MKAFKILAMAAAIGAGTAMTSCLEDDVDTILIDPAEPSHDNNGGGGKPGGKPQTYDLRVYMTDLRHPDTGEWPRLVGSGSPQQNAWVAIDGNSAKAEFINSNDNPSAHPFKADIALLVDNSESMMEENDAIARDIAEWTEMLAEAGVDACFAVVGHSETGTINGATDFSTSENLNAFFNFLSGSNRTAHFGGPGSDRLQRLAATYPTLNTECCMLALRFGNDNLAFRDKAERVYINFTDEPNQPNGNADYSVDWLTANWKTGMGEVHTIYSAQEEEPDHYAQYIKESARLLSDRTGGSVTYTDERLSNVSMKQLGISQALAHSYIARISDVSPYADGQEHQVKITVRTADGKVTATKNISVIFD